MSDKDELDPPPTGAYPGFDRGLQLLDAWRNVLHQQANIVNGIWSKLKGGKFKAEDGYKAIVETVENSAASAESMLATLSGVTNPPWVSLPPDAKGAVSVRLRTAITDQHEIRGESRLSRLGGADDEALTATVTRTGTYSIDVVLDEAAERSGEYIGFVSSDTYPGPLAILSVSVPRRD